MKVLASPQLATGFVRRFRTGVTPRLELSQQLQVQHLLGVGLGGLIGTVGLHYVGAIIDSTAKQMLRLQLGALSVSVRASHRQLKDDFHAAARTRSGQALSTRLSRLPRPT